MVMRILVVLFTLLLSFAVQAASISPCKLVVADRCFSSSEVSSLVILYSFSTIDGGVTTFRDQDGGAYVVPGAQSLRVLALKTTGNTAARATLHYANTAVGPDSGSLGTTPIGIGGGTTAAAMHFFYPLANSKGEFSLDFLIPTGKYPAAYFAGGTFGSVVIYGKLE
jgi:hypothetical protein